MLIAPIILLMTIHELPVGGQKSIWGNMCYVLVEIDTTVNNLPSTLHDMQTISVKSKCKKQYKIVQFPEKHTPKCC